MAFAILLAAGCSLQTGPDNAQKGNGNTLAAKPISENTPAATQATQPENTRTYISDKYKFSLEYPSNWQIADKESEGQGIVISAGDQKNEWGGTNLNLNFTWESGDVGMGWKELRKTEFTNPYGLKFALSFNIYDEVFYKEQGEAVPNKDDIMVVIGNDTIPGLKIFTYNTIINGDGEKQLMEILNSVKKTQ